MHSLFIRWTSKLVIPQLRYYETYTGLLKNGIRVAVEETSSPLSCVSLLIQTGPRFETAEKNGISHFIEHMACMGFECMNSQRLEDCLNCIGGHVTATTTREYQTFSGLAPTDYTLDLINILSFILTNLELRDSNIQKEKETILMELKDCENSPERVVFDYLHQAAFQGTSLAQCVIGPIENIQNFDEQDVKSFFKEQYKPENIVLAVSGAVSHLDVMSQAQKRFTHIFSESNHTVEHNLCRYTGSSMVYRDDSMPFAHVAVALEVPGYGHPDFWPLYVANCILGVWDRSQGGGDANGAYLARAAAVCDSCEFYEPFYITYKDIGLWGVNYVAEKENLDRLMHNIQEQWMHFCTSITTPEVQRGINYAKLKISKKVESSFNSCLDVGLEILYTCARTPLKDKYRKINDVKVDNIKEIGQKYIYDKCPVISAVGPTECLPDYLRIRSEMYSLRY